MNDSAMNDPAKKSKGTGKNPASNGGTQSGRCRVHILSGLISGLKVLLALVTLVLIQNLEHLDDMVRTIREQDLVHFTDATKAGILGGLGLALAVSFGLSILSWSRKSYELTAQEFVYTFGVISRNKKSARYDRIQAVDIKQPLFPRLLGLAEVGVETAGGKESRFAIQYVSAKEAERLRTVLFDKAGMRDDDDESLTAPEAVASDAVAGGVDHVAIDQSAVDQSFVGPHHGKRTDTEVLARIPRSLLILSVIPEMIFALVMALAALAMQIGTEHKSKTLLAFVILLPILLGAYKNLNRRWDFTLSLDHKKQQLTYSSGLGDISRQSVPLKRVHGVKLEQPWWWRPVGLWRVQLAVAGYGLHSVVTETTVILPCGRRQTAERVFARLMPVLTNGGRSMQSVDGQARIVGQGAVEGQTRVDYLDPEAAQKFAHYVYSPRVKWMRPFTYKNNAADFIGDTHAVTYGGRIGRVVACSRLEHIQEISLRQGPLQRKAGVATVEMHLVIGPVEMVARNLELDQARELLNRLNERKLPRELDREDDAEHNGREDLV